MRQFSKCQHKGIRLTVEFEGKSYPKVDAVRGYPMLRCVLCDTFGEIRPDGTWVWSEEKYKPKKGRK